EPFPVEAADPNIFDGSGLDRHVCGLCPRDRRQPRRGTEEKAFHHLHLNLRSHLLWEGSVSAGCLSTPGSSPAPRTTWYSSSPRYGHTILILVQSERLDG